MTMKGKLLGHAAAAALMSAKAPAGEAQSKGLVFLPITKVDQEQRLVYARITDETVDLAGEICDYDTSAPLFKAWSDNQAQKSDGKSFGNLRAMHQPVAAGKLTSMTCDDAAKAIDCIAKVVDDAEWAKVQEGVYTGLSLGGQYVGKRWKDPSTSAMRYTVAPVEVSLVDLPCNPSATFEMVKAAGVERVAFHPYAPDNAAVFDKAKELQKSAGGEPGDHIEAARKALVDEHVAAAAAVAPAMPLPGQPGAVQPPVAEPAAAQVDPTTGQPVADPTATETVAKDAPEPVNETLEQVWQAKADGSVHPTKAAAKAHVGALVLLAVNANSPVAKALAAARAAVKAGEPAADPAEHAGVTPGLVQAAAALKVLGERYGDRPVVKSMWNLIDFGQAMQTLVSVQQSAAYEAEYEDDGSVVHQQMIAPLGQLGEALVAMAREEVAELLGQMRDDGAPIVVQVLETDSDPLVVELAAGMIESVRGDIALVEKAGARNSKKDKKKIQEAHDAMAALGADCDPKNAGKAAAPEGEAGERVEKLAGENEALKAQVGDAVTGLAEITETVKGVVAENAKLRLELDTVKKAPAPMPTPAAGAVQHNRGSGSGGDGASETTAEQDMLALIQKAGGVDGMTRLMVKAAQTQPFKIA